MKLKIFFILFFYLTSVLCSDHRSLIILNENGHNENIELTLNQPSACDWHPAGFGAMSATLLNALHEEAAPILVHKKLWLSVCEHRKIFSDFITKEISTLSQIYSKYKRFESRRLISEFKKICEFTLKAYNKFKYLMDSSISQESFEKSLWTESIFDKKNCPEQIKNIDEVCIEESWIYVLCFKIPVEKYIVKECSNCYLFIPKKLEQDSGLKIEKLKTVEKPLEEKHKKNKNILFYKELSNIFETNKKYKWTFYISGHGDFCQEAQECLAKQKKILKNHKTKYEKYKKSKAPKEVLDSAQTNIKNISRNISNLLQAQKICGMATQQWRNLILELNKINTHLLIYDTCSAGGQNCIDAYQINKKPIILNFPIISTSLNETEVHFEFFPSPLRFYKDKNKLHNVTNFDRLKKSKSLISSSIRFSDFFEKAKKANSKEEFEECLKDISIWFCKNTRWKDDKGNIKRGFLSNIPTIRLAKEICFTPVKLIKEILKIDKSNTGETTCINPTEKIACLLNTESVTKEIEIEDAGTFPSFVSILPGKAVHKISKISARSYLLSDIIEAFFPFEKLNSTKVFYVKMLIAKDNILSYGNITKISNLFFMNNICDTNDERINVVILSNGYNYFINSWPFEGEIPEDFIRSFETISTEEIEELFEKNNLKFSDFVI